MFRSLALVSSLVFVACPDAHAQILALKNPPKPRVNSTTVARQPSFEAARALALSFEDAVEHGWRDEAFALFDLDALLERASKSVPATNKVEKHFRDGASAAWTSDAGVVGVALATVASGGRLRWLHVAERDGESAAVFRLERADATAPEYVELVLAPRGEKAAIAVDVRTSSDGVAHSRVLRRWLLALVADAGRTLPSRIAGEDRAFAQAGRTFESIDRAFEGGRNADALAAWSTLPEELRLDPSVVLARLRAAFAAGTTAFDQALGEVRAAGRTDAGTELLAIDVAMATNRPSLALEALDNLARVAPKDAYLDALRGSILRELGHGDEARAACRLALETDPTLADAYWTLLGLAIENERYEEAASLITRMDRHFEIDWREVASSPSYAQFLESKPGARWRAQLASSR